MTTYLIESPAGPRGPFTLNQLRSQWTTGALTVNDRFREADIEEWSPITELLGLLESSHHAATAPGTARWVGGNPGAAPVSQQVMVSVRKSRGVFIVLGLFLGMLGIHNFYAGFHGKGAAQLLLTLITGWLVFPLVIVWIWAVIEICTTEADAAGNAFD